MQDIWPEIKWTIITQDHMLTSKSPKKDEMQCKR